MMLKKFFIFASLALVMCSFTGTINYFEGTITYEIKYESNDPVISTDMLAKQYGDKMIVNFSIEKDNFSEDFNGTKLLLNSYSFLNNHLFVWGRSISSEIKNYIDCSKSNETLKSIEQKTSTEKILDHTLSLVSITAEPSNDGEEHFTMRDYYFSYDLFIQEGTFNICKYNSYDQIYSKTNTLPLKMVFENAAYKVTYTAIKIESN